MQCGPTRSPMSRRPWCSHGERPASGSKREAYGRVSELSFPAPLRRQACEQGVSLQLPAQTSYAIACPADGFRRARGRRSVATMATPARSTLRTRDVLWADVEDVYAAILAHPFLTGLADGTLPRESFRHYIVQDAHYLRGYARALTVCAAKAPDESGTVMFAEHAAQAIAAERDLHA